MDKGDRGGEGERVGGGRKEEGELDGQSEVSARGGRAGWSTLGLSWGQFRSVFRGEFGFGGNRGRIRIAAQIESR